MKTKLAGILWVVLALALVVAAGIFFNEWIDTAGVLMAVLMMILAVAHFVASSIHTYITYFKK